MSRSNFNSGADHSEPELTGYGTRSPRGVATYVGWPQSLRPLVCGRGMMRPVDTNPRSRYIQRNQGAERVGQVLELLSLAARPLSLRELSEQLGMHASTAHRLLKTLEDEGLITRPDATELYRLGPTILRLSTRMLSQYPVRDIAAPYLYRLSLDLGLTVSLSK